MDSEAQHEQESELKKIHDQSSLCRSQQSVIQSLHLYSRGSSSAYQKVYPVRKGRVLCPVALAYIAIVFFPEV